MSFPEAVIFDVDGLLIDSEKIWCRTEREFLCPLGVPKDEIGSNVTKGMRMDEIIDYFFKKYPWKKVSRKEVYDKIVSKMILNIKNTDLLLPGAKETVYLAKKMGCKIGLATSSSKKYLKAVIKKLELEKIIDAAHSAEDEEFGKPHPAVYLSVIKKLKVDANNCLALEDSPNGVLSAKSARLKCIAVPERNNKSHQFFCIADFVANSLFEVDEEVINSVFGE